MTPSFKVLGILSVALKVYAFLTLFLMAVGLVGIFLAGEATAPQRFQIVLNMVLGGTLFFMVLYGLGEMIRLLLHMEAKMSKEKI